MFFIFINTTATQEGYIDIFCVFEIILPFFLKPNEKPLAHCPT